MNLSNTTFNNATFTLPTMPSMPEDMHASAARLYLAAKQLASVEGKSAVARALNESPQVVNNWEKRGVSESGALKAQAVFGCDANWVLSGEGGMVQGWPFPRVSVHSFLRLDAGDRDYVEGILSNAVEGLAGQPNANDARRFNRSLAVDTKASHRKRRAG